MSKNKLHRTVKDIIDINKMPSKSKVLPEPVGERVANSRDFASVGIFLTYLTTKIWGKPK